MALETVWIVVIVLSSIIFLMLISLVMFLLFRGKKKKNKPKKVEEKIIEKKATASKELKKDKLYVEVLPSEYFKRVQGRIRRWRDNRRARKNPQRTFLIRMQMVNNRHREFLVKEDKVKKGFYYNGGRYIFDPDAMYYIIDSNVWALDYHESLDLPVKRNIPVQEVKKAIEATASKRAVEVENAVNPSVLERFIKAEIAQGILRGASLGALFKVLVILVIITMLIAGIDMVLDIYSSGLIEQFSQK
ncbi:MAG: hypothetical protein GWO07_07105 [Candidatus Dadabacteria bacterium]|nr:hypothetical protein [Candidatus Dadabacteria bacterium]NIS08518.1 hypothetical protein [Candidatus Dadabacteria bacterium]NIV12559.1 hypothetical protein [Fodinibius sp.]NIY22408.1 hypothetical protein [Candidatus Dadabacteria bacterium]